MATPLGTTFSTDEQIVAQGDITYMGKMVESLIVEFDQAKYEEFLSSSSKSPRARQYRKVFSKTRSQVRSEIPSDVIDKKSAMVTTLHVTPTSTSLTRPARLALLIFSPFMPVLFLSFRLPGVPCNPYGITRTLNVDRDDARSTTSARS